MPNEPHITALITELEGASMDHLKAQQTAVLLGFMDQIGLAWRWGAVADGTFLPGLEVVAGELVIDLEKLRFPGDILHEAGHIALIEPELRQQFSGNVAESLPSHMGDEVAVILWTYAACLHLDIPVDFVIHDAGYHDNADWLRELYAEGNFIGLPLLVWMGLCEDPKKAKAEGREGFPTMLRWVR